MSFVKKIKYIIIMLAFTLMLSSCSSSVQEDKNGINVTASFYPIYIITSNIVEGIDDINLNNMAQPQTGCLHNYQLSTSDMRILSESDLFIINGGGMEVFLDNALELFPNLSIIDSSEGVHEAETSHSHNKHSEHGEHCENDTHNHEHNPHFWIYPENAIIQAQNICDALCNIYPEKEDLLKANTENFIASVKEAENFDGHGIKSCVFNEAFDYLEMTYGIHVELCVEMGENETPSAKELAEIITAVKNEKIELLIAADDASKAIADTIARETEAKVIVLDPVLAGNFEPSAYVDALNNNARVLKGSVNK